MLSYSLDDAVFHMNANGEMAIDWKWSRARQRIRAEITRENPVKRISVTNKGIKFKLLHAKDEYLIFWEGLGKCTGGYPTRLLNWSGDGAGIPTRVMHFVYDLISEVLYYNFHKNVMHHDVELEVEYLKERYRECSQYIDKLNLDEIVKKIELSQSAGVGAGA